MVALDFALALALLLARCLAEATKPLSLTLAAVTSCFANCVPGFFLRVFRARSTKVRLQMTLNLNELYCALSRTLNLNL